ncbi:MAG: ArsR family transcriptional regulator, arsenate/arsenite/antimonite-responsive transcriptional [Frankiaceae bacterium]|jgi:ArsR family transcriptional regulator|nr:ArsR family transcriptional regulator, arsenate/arsenite/antimonite-responsive transcriptional [Frankiaceae bacterium]MDQ1715027.1 ArsR family transcriptional regulator, arsenate/arsenite/antimonite-responsive transcriptional [Frankiaceae bacterium]
MAGSTTIIDLRGESAVAYCGPIQSVVVTDSEVAQAAHQFKALADPVRLRLLNLLANAPRGEISACDLVEPAGKSQPTVSHHLKVLREAGFVRTERRGQWIYYSIVPEQLAALSSILGVPSIV